MNDHQPSTTHSKSIINDTSIINSRGQNINGNKLVFAQTLISSTFCSLTILGLRILEYNSHIFGYFFISFTTLGLTILGYNSHKFCYYFIFKLLQRKKEKPMLLEELVNIDHGRGCYYKVSLGRRR